MRAIRSCFLIGAAAALLTGCSGAGLCTDGESRCGGRCVPALSDPENCGGCGVACDAEQVCSLGSCQESCEPGLERCDRSCVDLGRDPRNCGGCGTDCGEGGVCQEGVCGGKTDAGPGADAGATPPSCQERVPLQSSGVYDIPLKVVALSGRVTRNGDAIPEASASTSRGRLAFANLRGGERRMAPLPGWGEATYQGELFAGSYDVFYEPPSSCSEASPLPCQRAKLKSKLALQQSGTLDLDLKVIAVSGRLTRSGAKLPDGASSRGSIAFVLVDGGERRMPALSATGEATYQGELFAGTYDVYYQPPSSCSEHGPLPCQRARLRSKLTLQQSGTLDLDLKVIAISGRLTRNGAKLADGTTSRGSIAFALVDGGERRMPALSAVGEATYQGELVAGTYDVFYQPPSSCVDKGPLPCQRAKLHTKLALQQSGTLDLDLKVVSLSGRVTRNGGVLADGSRGSIAFVDEAGERRMPSLTSTGEATYQGELLTGTYDILYQPPSSCAETSPLPCQRAKLRAKLAVQQSGTLDLDLKVVTVSGRVTRNGGTVAASTTGRGAISFSTETGERRMPPLGATGEATYQGELLAGAYDILYQPPSSCSETSPLPCQRAKLRGKVAVQQSGTLDVDLIVIAVSGRVTRNGAKLPDAQSSRGAVLFGLWEGSERRMPSLSASGEATFQGELFAGSYDITYQPPSSCSEAGPLPCQSFLVAGCPAAPPAPTP